MPFGASYLPIPVPCTTHICSLLYHKQVLVCYHDTTIHQLDSGTNPREPAADNEHLVMPLPCGPFEPTPEHEQEREKEKEKEKGKVKKRRGISYSNMTISQPIGCTSKIA